MCKHPVRKVISRINVPEVTKPLSVSDAKAAGFTVLERRDKGVYENCDDKVPGNISAFFSEYII